MENFIPYNNQKENLKYLLQFSSYRKKCLFTNVLRQVQESLFFKYLAYFKRYKKTFLMKVIANLIPYIIVHEILNYL